MGTLALIGLGSNLGDRRSNLDAAIAALRATPEVRVRAVSKYYQTAPVGGPAGQGAFLNAAALLDVELSPVALHRLLIRTEERAGRVRSERWGERSLDLDLLLFGDKIVDTTELMVPHPRMTVRRFVMAPCVDIAPEAVHPVSGWTLAELLQNLDRTPRMLVLRWPGDDGKRLFRRVVDALGAVAIGDGSWQPQLTNAPKGKGPEPTEKRLQLMEADLAELRESLPNVAASQPDRWIVSDRWFDHLFPFLLGHVSKPVPLWDRLQAEKAGKLSPTFEFRPRRKPGWTTFHAEKWSRREHPLFDYPILTAHADGLDEAADEIVAACAACRLEF